MRTSESSIVEALSRIAETFSKLVVQHVQLLRSEVESEARSLGERGRAFSIVVAKAVPFILAGLVLTSLGVAHLLALLVEPMLGRAATPLAFLLVGGGETAFAGLWLKRHLPQLARPSSVTQPRDVNAPKGEQPTAPSTERAPDAEELRTLSGQSPGSTPNPAQPSRKAEESLYGAVGRA